ncbi:MAG: phosphopentomutase [Polyangia bacterium]
MMGQALDRVILIVLDSCGCGAAPDAAQYGDAGADTLGNLSRRVGGISLPNLERLGLGHLTEIAGVAPVEHATGAFGKLRETSNGKDTTTGHWEMTGLQVDKGFPTFPHGFPSELMARFEKAIGRGTLGNKPASGTEIIEELGPEHLETGKVIVYTSADSVFQVAAHEEIVPLEELYRICEIARKLCDEIPVARVIARPFIGEPGAFKRTYNRRDFSMPPAHPTVLDAIADAKLPVVGVGKIWDIFAGRGLSDTVRSQVNHDAIHGN